MRCLLACAVVGLSLGQLAGAQQNGATLVPRLGAAPRADLAPAPPVLLERPIRGAGLEVDTAIRQQVVSFFDGVYSPALAVPSGWTGSTATCDTGTIAPAFAAATLQMIDYYRAMVGLPADLGENSGASDKADEAALMMRANGALSHSPPPSWLCYTAAGAEAAGKSNLAFGAAGPGAITLYIFDFGAGNTAAGHRRWIFFPPLFDVGSGETSSTNALWVISTGAHPIWGPRPASPEWVAWPPAGYVPYQVVYPRWSLGRNPSADLSGATVSMTVGGAPIAVNVLPVHNGYGDNSLVWEPSGILDGPGILDQTVAVTVSNILVGGTPRTVHYDVIIIDPALVVGEIFSDGFESGSTSAWSQVVP